MVLNNKWLVLIILVFLSCSHQEEFTYVDRTWEPEVLMVKANEYLQDQDYDHAFEAFQVIFDEYPTSRLYTDAVLGIAYIYGKTEQYEKQMDLLLTLVNENIVPSKIPAIYNQIAEFYEKTSTILREINPDDTTDLAKAISFYKKGTQYPLSADTISKAESFYKIALIQFQLGKREKGLATLEKITVDFPGNPWAVQASNFLNNYHETGILPGVILEGTVDSEEIESDDMPDTQIEETPSVDPLMTPRNVTEQMGEEDTMVQNGMATEADSTQATAPKSILEEIPDAAPKTSSNLDSLLNKLDQ